MGKIILTVAIIIGVVFATLATYSTVAMKHISQSEEERKKDDDEQERAISGKYSKI